MMCVFGIDNGGVVLRSAVISAVAEAIDKGTDIFAAIQAAPAVDAVEVVRGHWTMTSKFVPVIDLETSFDEAKLFREHKFQQCSVCGKDPIVDNYGYLHWDFCPNCGARMDEVRE